MSKRVPCPLRHDPAGCIDALPEIVAQLVSALCNEPFPHDTVSIPQKQAFHGAYKPIRMQCPLCEGTREVAPELAAAFHLQFGKRRSVLTADEVIALRKAIVDR